MHTLWLRSLLKITPVTLFLALAAAAAPAASGTVVQTHTPVPSQHDACLDHTVKELGMSAKKAEDGSRRWNIAPKFLHGALSADPASAFFVEFEKTDKATLVRVTASWSGSPKEAAVQAEIEERLRAMTGKMAQLCGVTKAAVECATIPPGGKPAACPVPAPAP